MVILGLIYFGYGLMLRFLSVLILILLETSVAWGAPTSLDITVSSEVDVSTSRYEAKGDRLILWLPSESGTLEQERRTATKLAGMGVEVWFADLHAAYFLPLLASSTEKIPAKDVVTLMQEISKRTQKKIYLAGSGRGALLALRAANEWQKKYPAQSLLYGLILISPKLYVETPDPGMEGQLMPIVSNSNFPIYILQPNKSPWYWKMDRIIAELEKSGSDIYLRILQGVRDRFYYRPDAIKAEDTLAQQLPDLMLQGIGLLEPFATKERKAAKNSVKAPVPVEGKKDRVLQEYKGDPSPPALNLEILNGDRMSLEKVKGKVVLVNFWASWCPPCVHEMPSMERLANRYSKQGLVILGVNMAEDEKTIQSFLRNKVKVSFPILLDRDGSALKRWKVFAFPTSYVVDRKGRIRLALFGSIDWEQNDVIEKLEKLLQEN